MAKIKLQHDEVVLLKYEKVQHGNGRLSSYVKPSYNDELVLTNLHLIAVDKGVIGNVTQVEYYPLNEIKVFNDQAQALYTENSVGSDQLDVYFHNGEETFKFEYGGKKEIGKWVAAINKLVTGKEPEVEVEVEVEAAKGRVIPGTILVAETLRDTLGQFRGSFGTGRKGSTAPVEAAPIRVSSNCSGCGASISGTTGTVAKCQYCDSESMLP